MDRRAITEFDDWDKMRARFHWALPQHMNIADMCCDQWARNFPDKIAIRHLGPAGPRDWTYGELKAASDSLALSFAAKGLARGDRVAVLLPQSPEVMITHFAAQKLGAIILPLFTLFGPDALQYRLTDSGARAIVTDADNLDKILALDTPDLENIYSINPAPAPVLDFYDQISAANTRFEMVATMAEDPATLIYTSGTTGPAKGVLHAHRFLLGHLPSIETSHPKFPLDHNAGWTPADWAWIGGLMDMALPCLFYGIPLISHRIRKFDPEKAFKVITEHQATALFMPPTALRMMQASRAPVCAHVRSISSGGESLGSELTQWASDCLGATLSEIYGQTECNLVIGDCPGVVSKRSGTMGKPVPGVDVKILDPAGLPIGAGELGEIAVKRGAPQMFLRYWNKPEKTAEKYHGNWLRTGDLGVQDSDGYITYVSRDDDVINSAGYRIGPTEIENCLTGDRDVVMAAAIGIPDKLRGEAIKVFVTLTPNADRHGIEDRLTQRVRNRLSPHMAPKEIEIRAELPVTATGKIMRKSLRSGS